MNADALERRPGYKRPHKLIDYAIHSRSRATSSPWLSTAFLPFPGVVVSNSASLLLGRLQHEERQQAGSVKPNVDHHSPAISIPLLCMLKLVCATWPRLAMRDYTGVNKP